MIFDDRRHAGRLLGEQLTRLVLDAPVVLGLPRGGVPVADEVARALRAPLDVIIVRKLGVPFQPELGMGALGEDDVRVLNHDVIRLTHVSESELQLVEARERKAIAERVVRYRACRRPVQLQGRAVVIVDDGIATGGTMRAAVEVARARGAGPVIVAVPVAAPESVEELSQVADDVVALQTPRDMTAIGRWYREFCQTSDDEVMQILLTAEREDVRWSTQIDAPAVDIEVVIPVGAMRLEGHLTIPARCRGIVVFAHGSGSSRHSPRNRSVARALNQTGIGTLLFDLLADDEASNRRNVFDIELLAARLETATHWLAERDEATGLAFGYFGASTGAAAALWAAASRDSIVSAIVSRGGRPDLAIPRLADVRAPTLLIVGGRDDVVLDLNREAAGHLRCLHRISVVPGATHLFEETGTLERVSKLAADWFIEHLGAAERATPRSSLAGSS